MLLCNRCPLVSVPDLFLHWLLEYIPYKLLEDNQSFIDFLIGICLDSYHVGIKVTVARKLIFFRENEQVQNVLWNIVINNEQENSDEFVAACIWSLFINRKDDRFMEKRLKNLITFESTHVHHLFVKQHYQLCTHI